MPSSYTTRNRTEKQAAGENANTWGTRLNTNTIDLFDAAIDGMASYALSGTKTLTATDGAADEARMRFQNITSGTGGTVTIPNVEKTYLVRNATSGSVIFTTGSGTTATVLTGNTQAVVCAGGNIVYTANVPNFAGQLAFPATQNASADANTLDDYEEGTFTPSLLFGGAAAGMTYSNQSARYTKIGRVVHCEIIANLSAKGTSTGAATIAGLPFSANAAVPQAIGSIRMDATAGMTVPVVRIIQGASAITLENFAANVTTALADTNFTNATAVGISITYTV